jgi:hypothetical protein
MTRSPLSNATALGLATLLSVLLSCGGKDDSTETSGNARAQEQNLSPREACEAASGEIDIDGEMIAAIDTNNGSIECSFRASRPTATSIVCSDGRHVYPILSQTVQVGQDGEIVEVNPPAVPEDLC